VTDPGFRRGVRLAVDLGEVRIGVAACDADGVLAFPVSTVPAGVDEVDALLAVVREYSPIEVLVGLPRSLAGGEGPAALRARDRARRLAEALGVPVRLVDERLSTVTAAQRLRSGGRRAREQRGVIDAVAAAAILEHALSLERAQGHPPGELVSATGVD
jgi:putative holliday junction resolvase